MEPKKASKAVDTLVAAVMCKLDPMLDLVDHMAYMVQEAIMDTRKAADSLNRTREETRDKSHKA